MCSPIRLCLNHHNIISSKNYGSEKNFFLINFAWIVFLITHREKLSHWPLAKSSEAIAAKTVLASGKRPSIPALILKVRRLVDCPAFCSVIRRCLSFVIRREVCGLFCSVIRREVAEPKPVILREVAGSRF